MLNEPDTWSAMAGVSVPVAPWSFGRVRGAAEAKRFEVEAGRQGVSAMRAMLLAEVLDHAAHLRAAAAVLAAADSSTIPLTRQALEAALAQYRAGTGELRMLLDSRRMLVDSQRARDLTVMDLLQAQAALDLAVGTADER
jgi:outer membrane protein TolC